MYIAPSYTHSLHRPMLQHIMMFQMKWLSTNQHHTSFLISLRRTPQTLSQLHQFLRHERHITGESSTDVIILFVLDHKPASFSLVLKYQKKKNPKQTGVNLRSWPKTALKLLIRTIQRLTNLSNCQPSITTITTSPPPPK